jgi:hypothetical protein
VELEEAAARARRYLDASTSGRWEEAARYVADPARFVFPTGTFDTLEAMRDGLARRYTDLVKQVETTDIAARPDGSVVVVVAGTLAGVNLHGVPFRGVRFLDRLVLRDGVVVEQHVHNDLAVSGVLDRRVPS